MAQRSARFTVCHSPAKPHLLLVATAYASAAALVVLARLFTRSLSLATIASQVPAVFGQVATLWGSLAAPMASLALPFQKKDEDGLREYPRLLTLNVAAIAVTSAPAETRTSSRRSRTRRPS